MSGAAFEYVTLTVDGYVLIGFQDITIERSMQKGAIAFTLVATAPSWSAQAMSLRQGKDVVIRSSIDLDTARRGGGDLLCKGAVDTYESEIGENTHKVVTISGRSKGRDAIDCPPVKHKTGRVENKTLVDVAKEFDEFGIGYVTDLQLETIALVQRHPEEPLHDTLERHARRQGLMLSAQPDGTVNITRAGSKRHAGAIVEGSSPVRKLRIHLAPHTKRSPTVVRGQKRLGHGKDSLRQEVQDDGDSEIGHRPALVIAEGDHTVKDLKRRAEWERLRKAGYGMQVTAIVSRWRDDNGEFWDPGRLLATRVPSEDLDQDLTLSTARFRQSEGASGGTTAELSLVDPKAHGGKAGAGKSDAAFSAGDGLEG